MIERPKRAIASNRAFVAAFAVPILFAVLAVAYFEYRPELAALWAAIKSEDSHPAVLLVSFLVLPIVGFPVAPLLVLLGLRFGIVVGVVFMFGIIPAHLAISYWVSRSFLRERIAALAEKKDYKIPELPENKRLAFGIAFMVVPGLSYALKNILLPQFGLSFFKFFFCGWLIQGIMGVPFVVLGEAASRWSLPLLLGLIGFFLLLFVSRKWIGKKYKQAMKSVLEERGV